MTQSWTDVARSPKSNRLVWRKWVLPTLLPITIIGGLVAAFAEPILNRQITVLSLFMEPADGVVVGVNGPHRFFPVSVPEKHAVPNAQTVPDAKTQQESAQVKPIVPVTSADEFNDLDSLAIRLGSLRRAESLMLIVSAVARNEQGRVLLMTSADQAANAKKVYLQDLLRTVNQTASRRRLIILDIQWPEDPESLQFPVIQNESEKSIAKGDSGEPRRLYALIQSTLMAQPDPKSTYVVTAGQTSWAYGMEAPRQSAFLHFWNQALASRLTDRDGDGRFSVAEVIWQVKNNLATWSRDNCQFVQSPVVIGDASFDLGPVHQSTAVEQGSEVYPHWLTTAWQKRDDYLGRYDIALDSEFLDQWQRKLLAIESRWRRSINDVATEAEAMLLNDWADNQILNQMKVAASLRPESLWLAAKAAAIPGKEVLFRDAVDRLVVQLEEMKTSPDDPASAKAIVQILATQFIDFQKEENLTLLDAIVDRLCGYATFDKLLAVTAITLSKQLKVEDTYAETLVLQQILSRGGLIDELDFALLRLTRLRSQLGDRPRLFAVMAPRLNLLLGECLTAEQFYWFDGFTTDDNVRRQVIAALMRVEVGLSQQQCIEQAISTVENAVAFLRCGQALPHHELRFLEILHNTEKLTSVLYQHPHNTTALRIDAAAVRFESIRYLAEQLQSGMLALVNDTVAHSNSCACDALLSIVPASIRPQVYQKLLAGKKVSRGTGAFRPCIGRSTINGCQTTGSEQENAQKSDLSDMMARINKLESTIEKADEYGAQLLGAWVQELAQTLATTHDPTGYYQNLANRLRFCAGESSEPSLIAQWQSAPVSWQNRRAELVVRVPETGSTFEQSKLTVLEAASSSLRAFPSGTTVAKEQPGRFKFDLDVRSDGETPRTLKGVWIRCERAGNVKHVPVRFADVQSCQIVELNLEAALLGGPDDNVWRLWPKQQPQSFDWTVVNHDVSPRNVIVTIEGCSETVLQSAPLALSPGIPQTVRFPSKSEPSDQDSTHSQKSLAKQLTVIVSDIKSNEVLLERVLNLALVDVRSCIELRKARFDVLEHGGANALTIELKGTDSADPRGHQVQLALNTDNLPTLQKIGSGNVSVQLFPKEPARTLALRNLFIAEGSQSGWSIPLAVDGDTEVIRLSGLTPYVGGSTSWQLDSQPQILIDAPPAVVPGASINVNVAGMNLPSSEHLVIELGQYDASRFVTHYQTVLPAPRCPRIHISSGGATSTLNVQACFDRWNVKIPAQQVDGQYELRARTVANDSILATRNILMDDDLPRIISASADLSDLTKINVSTLPGPSGIVSVCMLEGDKSPIIGVRKTNNDETQDQWMIQSKKPVSRVEPTVVTLQATSVAGKTATIDLPVKIEAPITTGTLEGILVEGSIPQPHLAITMSDTRGRTVQLQTDQDGGFRCTLPAGSYLVSAQKKATGRRAEVTVKIQPARTSQARLELLLPKPSAKV